MLRAPPGRRPWSGRAPAGRRTRARCRRSPPGPAAGPAHGPRRPTRPPRRVSRSRTFSPTRLPSYSRASAGVPITGPTPLPTQSRATRTTPTTVSVSSGPSGSPNPVSNWVTSSGVSSLSGMRSPSSIPASCASTSGTSTSSTRSSTGRRPSTTTGVNRSSRLRLARGDAEERHRPADDLADDLAGPPRRLDSGQRLDLLGRHGVGEDQHPGVVQVGRGGQPVVRRRRTPGNRRRGAHHGRDQPGQQTDDDQRAPPGAQLGTGHRAHRTPRRAAGPDPVATVRPAPRPAPRPGPGSRGRGRSRPPRAPPTAPTRSVMFCRPWPSAPAADVEARSVVLDLEHQQRPRGRASRTVAVASGACLAMFCSASRQQKYSAASTSASCRSSTPSISTVTVFGLRWTTARSASGSPAWRSSGG